MTGRSFSSATKMQIYSDSQTDITAEHSEHMHQRHMTMRITVAVTIVKLLLTPSRVEYNTR